LTCSCQVTYSQQKKIVLADKQTVVAKLLLLLVSRMSKVDYLNKALTVNL